MPRITRAAPAGRRMLRGSGEPRLDTAARLVLNTQQIVMIRYIFILGTPAAVSSDLGGIFERTSPEARRVHRSTCGTLSLSNRYLCGACRRADMLRAATHMAARIRRRMHRDGRKVYVRTAPDLFGFAGVLESTFTMPFVIHVVCHPFTCIEKSLQRQRSPCQRLADRLRPYGRMRGDVCGDFTREHWETMTLIEQSAWYWEKVNAFIDAAGRRTRQYRRVRLEDLAADPAVAQGLLRFCGMDGANPALTLPRPPDIEAATRTWPAGARERVVRHCRRLAERFGYDLDHHK